MRRTLRLFLDMFEPHERRSFALLMGIVAITAVFEVISVASVLPFLQVLSQPEVVEGTGAMARLYEMSGAETPVIFAQWLGVISIVVILVGMVMRIGSVYALTRFAFQRFYTISTRVLAGYLSQPYPWFLLRNSSALSKTVLSETEQVIYNALLPFLRVIQAAMTVALTGFLLMVVEPVVASGAVVLIGGCYVLVYITLRGRLRRVSERMVKANKQRFRIVYEAMGGVKEIKFLNLERGINHRYSDVARTIVRERTFATVAGQVPRFLLEGVAFSSLILAVLLLILTRGGNIVDLIPIFGLLAVAMARLFPALQMVYNQVAILRGNEALVELVHKELTSHGTERIADVVGPAPPALPPLKPDQTIAFDQITYSYPGADSPGLADMSFEIPVGGRIGIVGGTGAGKTTLIDLLLGLFQPDEGRILVDGIAVTPDMIPQWQAAIGYVPQDIALWDMSVRENIAFGQPADQIDTARVEAAARSARLHDFVVDSLPEGYDTIVGDRGVRLSGGQRQRIGIARSLYNDPEVLIFDEATSALDNITERSVMSAIEDLSGRITVIMVAHRLSTVRTCDRIFVLEHGRIIASGTYDELIETNETFRSMAIST